MSKRNIEFENIIDEKIIKSGGVILVSGRPGVGKTHTCNKIVNSYCRDSNFLYFNLSGDESSYWLEEFHDKVMNGYFSSIEIIKKIQDSINLKIKFVFIDYLQLINDTGEWFFRMLVNLAYTFNLIIIITSQLDRRVESRRKHLPIKVDINKLGIIVNFAIKIIVIHRPAIYSSVEKKDEMVYYSYRD